MVFSILEITFIIDSKCESADQMCGGNRIHGPQVATKDCLGGGQSICAGKLKNCLGG